VGAGALQDLESYRIGLAMSPIRQAGSRKATKHARNPFTAEDDRILYDYVNGAAFTNGNAIYQKLAELVSETRARTFWTN
jgi:hypothetical protein